MRIYCILLRIDAGQIIIQYPRMKSSLQNTKWATGNYTSKSMIKQMFSSAKVLAKQYEITTSIQPSNSRIQSDPLLPHQLEKNKKNHSAVKNSIFGLHRLNSGKSIIVNKAQTSWYGSKKQQQSPVKKERPTQKYEVTTYERKLRETNSTQCQSPKASKNLRNPNVMKYRMIKLLGKGRFAQVYLARHEKTGFLGALKIIKKSKVFSQFAQNTQKTLSQLISEIKIQLYLDHPNLIKLYDFFSDEFNIYLFLELASDGQLYDLLQEQGTFSEETTSIIARQLAEGIKYMHSKSVIHRDIKLENIVFTHGMTKICDFGCSVFEPRQFRKTLCGTPLYLSPQILQGRRYNEKIDSWALGTIAYEIFTNRNPFNISNKEELGKIITMDFQMIVGSPEIRSFVNFILKKNPIKRPDADIILEHPFIKKYEDLETSEQICKVMYRRYR